MAIHNGEDLDAFATAGFPDIVAAALGCSKRGIDETRALIDRAFFAQRIGELRENFAQRLAFAPLLKSAMHRFVVGITLGEQMPLRTRVQNPQYGSLRHRLAAWTTFWDVRFGEMVLNPLPLVVTQPQHAGTYTSVGSPCQRF